MGFSDNSRRLTLGYFAISTIGAVSLPAPFEHNGNGPLLALRWVFRLAIGVAVVW
jgi:hypothetical protein